MKKILLPVITMAIVAMMAISCGNKEQTHSEHEQASGEMYTCPMHPEVIADKPGSCPKCGMDLVKKTPSDKTEHMHDSIVETDSSMKM